MACLGRGRVRREETVQVEIPAGIDDGMQLRLAGKGSPGKNGGPPGDLFVAIRLEPDDVFQRAGDDLAIVAEVPFPQAALGATIEVPTLGEPTEVEVPAGTQFGTVLRVRGEGMPRLRGRGKGDLLVHVKIPVPGKLSARARKLLEELAEEGGLETRHKASLVERIKENLEHLVD